MELKAIILITMVMMIGLVGAFEFDNEYVYDPSTKTAYIHDCDFWLPFGGCLSQGDIISEIRLIWGDTHVPVGLDTHVGTFNYVPYRADSIIQDLSLVSLKNNQLMVRGKQYKVKTLKEDNSWRLECFGEGIDEICNKVYTDDKINVTEWIPISNPKLDFVIGNEYEIGVFVDTQQGDYGDWRPKVNGLDIVEFSSFNASIINGLVFGYSFDHADDNDTFVVDVVRGVYNLSSHNDDPALTTGVNGSGMGFDADDKLFDTHSISEIGTGAITICLHFKATTLNADSRFFTIDTADDDLFLYWNEAGSPDYNQHSLGGGQRYLASITATGEWYQQCAVGNNGDEGELWINGVNRTTALIAGVNDLDSGLTGSGVLALGDITNDYFGVLDEIYIWNRTLSADEIVYIQNKSYDYFEAPDVDLVLPNVTLVSLSNGSAQVLSSISLNWSVTDNVNVSNSTLIFNGINNQTFLHGINNDTTFQVDWDLNDGSYNWTATAYDNSSNQGTTVTWFFTIDSTLPIVSITEKNFSYKDTLAESVILNLTITESNPDTCIYNYNGTNQTFTCTDTGLNFTIITGDTNISVWVNDTSGNTGEDYYSWTVVPTLVTVYGINYLGQVIETINWTGNFSHYGNPYSTFMSNWLNSSVKFRNITVGVYDMTYENVDANITFEMNYSTTNYTLQLSAYQLVITFLHENGSYANVLYEINTPKDNTVACNGTLLNMTSQNLSYINIIQYQQCLPRGIIRIYFNEASYGVNWTQYYEYINDYTTNINEEVTIMDDPDYQVYFLVTDVGNSPISDALVRAEFHSLVNLTWIPWKLIGQRLTPSNGIVPFWFDSGRSVYVTVTADGYQPWNSTLRPGELTTTTRSDPFQIKLKPSSNTVSYNVYIDIPSRIINKSEDIDISILAKSASQVKINTDYLNDSGAAPWEIPLSRYSGLYHDTLESGTDFSGASGDVEVHIYIDGQLVKVKTIEHVTPTRIFDVPRLDDTTELILGSIALIFISGIAGVLFASTTAGFTAFMVGTILIGLINSKFYWLTFIGVIYFVMRFAGGLIRD